MAAYTTLTANEIEQLTAPYDLGPLVRVEPLGGGLANSSFILSTADRQFVLSVCDEKDLAEIVILTSALDRLNAHGFLTSALIRTRDGRTHLELHGKPVYLKEYIDGEVVRDLTPEMLYQVGEALATLHEVPPFGGIPETFAYGLEIFDEMAGRKDAFAAWLRAEKGRFMTATPPQLPRGMIHGDLFYDNMLFEGGRLKAILDFEEVCSYFLIFDLGMCAAGSCTTEAGLSLELTAALVAGYQAKRRLLDLEKKFLQDHIAYGAAATAFWRYRQFNIIHPGSGRENAYLQMKNLADQVNRLDRENFNKAVFQE